MSDKQWRVNISRDYSGRFESMFLMEGDVNQILVWSECDEDLLNRIAATMNAMDRVKALVDTAYHQDESEAAKFINAICDELKEIE